MSRYNINGWLHLLLFPVQSKYIRIYLARFVVSLVLDIQKIVKYINKLLSFSLMVAVKKCIKILFCVRLQENQEELLF